MVRVHDSIVTVDDIDGLVQEICNSIANALELCLSRTHRDMFHLLTDTGGRLNKKDGLTRYGNSHVKDKTS